MKKKLTSGILLLALMTAVLAGCGNDAQSSSSTQASTQATATAAAAASAQESTAATSEAAETASSDTSVSDVQDALKGVSLNIGTSGTYAPFSYYAEDGTTLQGFDIDMLKALQDILGFTISGDELQAMDYSPLTTSVSQGKLDVAAAALCATDARKETMNFTDTYYDAGIVVVVGEDNDTIKSVDDLKTGNYKVAVQAGTIAYEYAAANLPESCLQTFDSQSLAYKAVEGNQADATIYDAPGTAYSIKTGEIKLKIVGDEFYTGQAPYAIALSFDICKQYPDIAEDFNKAIAELQANGTIDKLKAQWCE